MTPPPRPEVDRRSFGDELLKYHERLSPFVDGTIAALSSMAGLTMLTRSPIRITVPEEWVVPTPSLGWTGLASNPPTAYRKLPDGTMEVRGRMTYPAGTPASQAPIIPIPIGLEPAEREVFDCFAFNSPGGVYTPAVITCHSGALRWILGGATNLSFSGDVRWVAKDRTPAPWGSPFPLPINGSYVPSLVMVLAQPIGADKRPLSEWQLFPAAWTTPPERSTAAFLITRIPGLLVGRIYDLMVYAAA